MAILFLLMSSIGIMHMYPETKVKSSWNSPPCNDALTKLKLAAPVLSPDPQQAGQDAEEIHTKMFQRALSDFCPMIARCAWAIRSASSAALV